MSILTKRKTVSGKIVCKNGISLKTDMDFSLKESPDKNEYSVLQVIITILASFSTIIMAISFMQPELGYMPYPTIFFTVALATVAVACLNQQKTFFKAVGAVYLVLNTVFILAQIRLVINGLIYTAYLYTRSAGITAPQISQLYSEDYSQYTTIFFLALTFVITLGISIACIYRTNFSILFLCTFPIFELGAFWGWQPQAWTVVGMIMCWMVILSLNFINHRTRNRNSKNTFAVHKKKKTFYLTSESVKKSFFTFATRFIILITSIAFFIGCVISFGGTPRPESFTQLRKDISNGFGDFTSDIFQSGSIGGISIPGIGKSVGGTNGGQLGLYDKIDFSGKTALTVTADSIDKRMYLRGYTAENYSDNSWTPSQINTSVQESFSDLGNTLLDYNFLQLSGRVDNFSVSIRAFNANKDVIYAPYGTEYSACDNVDEQKYEGMISPIKRSKTYTLTGGQFSETSWEDMLITAESKSANSDERYNTYNIYSRFIMNSSSYTAVPDNLKNTLDDVIDSMGLTIGENYSAYYVSDCIKDYFSTKGFTYTLSPGITPSDEDFIEYFLTEQKEGYCTSYASAGVMLMRRLGIPARYVEGYVVEPEQFVDSNTAIKVTDESAHAWCEIFIENVGWFPVEFTPGYDNGNPNLTQKSESVSSSESDSSSLESESSVTDSRSDSLPKLRDSSSESSSSSLSESSSSNSDSDNSTDSRADYSGSTSTSTNDSDSGAGGGSGYGGSSGSGGSGDSGENGERTIGTVTFYAIFTLIFVLAVLVILVLRRKINLSKQRKSIYDSDSAMAIISCYKICLKWLNLVEIGSDENITDTQLAKIIATQLNKYDNSLAVSFAELAENAVYAHLGETHFSNVQNGDEIAEISRRTAKEIRSFVLGRLSGFERFTAKWISNLY